MSNKLNISGLLSFLALLFLIAFYSACETEFIPENINSEPELVVEGYIELGEDALPPYVILTRSRPFFNTIDSNQLNNIFVRGAEVIVSNNGQSVRLTEFCLNDLPLLVRKQVADQLGLDPDSLSTNICAYIDIQAQINLKEGQSYSLSVKAGTNSVNAITTIPVHVPLDSLWWKEAPGKPSDTLLQLMTRVNDPAGIKNFYRYFCSINGGEFNTPFNSVNDDALIDGKKFEFRLIKPNERGEDFDQSTFGLFKIGDSVAIKWSAIDESHFNFWNTLEFNKGNQGPFSTYTTINSNIKGGLGNWGGYHSKIYRLKVKRE